MKVLLVLAFSVCVFGQLIIGGNGGKDDIVGGNTDLIYEDIDIVGGNADGGCCETCGEMRCPLDGKCCKFWIENAEEYQGCQCGEVIAALGDANTDALWTEDKYTWQNYVAEDGTTVCNVIEEEDCETTVLTNGEESMVELGKMDPLCYFEDSTCKNMGSECNMEDTVLCGCPPPSQTLELKDERGCVFDCACVSASNGCPCGDEFEFQDGTCSSACPGNVPLSIYSSDDGGWCSVCDAPTAQDECTMCIQSIPECDADCKNCVITPQTCYECSTAVCMDDEEKLCEEPTDLSPCCFVGDCNTETGEYEVYCMGACEPCEEPNVWEDDGSCCGLCSAPEDCVMCIQSMPECDSDCKECAITKQTCTECSTAVCMDDVEKLCEEPTDLSPCCSIGDCNTETGEYEVYCMGACEPCEKPNVWEDDGSCCGLCSAAEDCVMCIFAVPECDSDCKECAITEQTCTECSTAVCMDDDEDDEVEDECTGLGKAVCKNRDGCDWEKRGDDDEKTCYLSLDLLCGDQVVCGCPPQYDTYEETDENGCVTECRCHDSCPSGSEYTLCGSPCAAECGKEEVDMCAEMCVEGCFCTEGLYKLLDGEDLSECVAECPTEDACAVHTEKEPCKSDVFCKWKKVKMECVTDDNEYTCSDHSKKKMCEDRGDGSEFGCDWDKVTKTCADHVVVCQDYHGNSEGCATMAGCYYQSNKDKCKPNKD